MRSTFWQNRIFEHQSCQFVTLASNSLQNGQTVRFSWKLYKTLFSGHAQHVLAISNLWASNFSKSLHLSQILTLVPNSLQNEKTVRFSWKLYKTLFSGHAEHVLAKSAKQCAFHENCTKRSFQVMRSTSWQNRICEGESCQNRHTGLKFSPKRENRALFMKIVQNPIFRSCTAPFWPNRIFERQSSQNRHTGLKFSSKWENSALFLKIVQNALFRSCEHVLAKSHLWGWKLSKSSHWPQILSKTGKQCAFQENCRYCAARFSQIAFLSIKVVNSSHWPEILFKTAKQCAFHENCTKRSFQIMRSTFWQNRICEGKSCQNRHTGIKFSPKRENSALFMKILGHAQHVLAKSHFWAPKLSIRHTGLKFSSKRPNSAPFMKIVQNALFRSCAARFGQTKFVSVKLLKILTLVPNSLQNGKTVRFSWKMYKTLFSGHAEHVLAKSNLWASNFSKFFTLVPNFLQNGKTVRFYWKMYKTLFSGHAEHVLAKSHLWEWKLSKSSHWPQILSKTGKQCAFHENCRSCAARFGKIAFLSTKVVNSSHWPEILFKTAKQCAFHENCTKRSFQVMRSTSWPNRICERQSCQNRHTGLKFSPKRENSALFMKIVQNALFRSCAARFGQIKFVSVKVLKIVTLASNSLQNGKTGRVSWKLYKTLLSGLAKSHLWGSKLSKSSRWPPQNGETVSFSWKLYKFLFSGHAEHVLAKSHFGASKLSKSLHLSQILFKTGKQCAFLENCTKRSFQVMRSTFCQNRICESESCQNRHTGLKFSPKRENSALFMKIVGHAQHVLAKSHFSARKFSIRHTGLKFSSKRPNSALFMKIAQNALFRSCGARFGKIAFVRVKVLKIVTLASNSLQNGQTVRFSGKL